MLGHRFQHQPHTFVTQQLGLSQHWAGSQMCQSPATIALHIRRIWIRVHRLQDGIRSLHRRDCVSAGLVGGQIPQHLAAFLLDLRIRRLRLHHFQRLRHHRLKCCRLQLVVDYRRGLLARQLLLQRAFPLHRRLLLFGYTARGGSASASTVTTRSAGGSGSGWRRGCTGAGRGAARTRVRRIEHSNRGALAQLCLPISSPLLNPGSVPLEGSGVHHCLTKPCCGIKRLQLLRSSDKSDPEGPTCGANDLIGAIGTSRSPKCRLAERELGIEVIAPHRRPRGRAPREEGLDRERCRENSDTPIDHGGNAQHGDCAIGL
mmetsp:Transcript_12689/g.44947  ORF Transcript_12689/g.44947 Transcript_12689/m.44947 type:complete len:317 (-) Transcript_12689:67-1017(-)